MDNDTKDQGKKSKKKFLLISILSIFLLVISLLVFYGYKLYSNIEKVKPTNEELGINSNNQKISKEIDYGTFSPGERFVNIALIGVDTRDLSNDTGTRADCIMILSIDRENKSMKLGSVARDTYVNIEGHEMDKINHAYAYGGPTFLVKTLNQNFDLNISNFVVVNFFGMAKIIDRLGGVEIEVDDEEIKYINDYINEIAKIEGIQCDNVASAGVHNLNGIQAVAYSRIRYTEGGDFKRTERQREVLLSLAKKSSNIKLNDIMPMINQLSSNLKTTLDAKDMLSLSTEIINQGYQSKMEEKMFPEVDYSGGQLINEVYYYVTDLDKAKVSMHKYFFGE